MAQYESQVGIDIVINFRKQAREVLSKSCCVRVFSVRNYVLRNNYIIPNGSEVKTFDLFLIISSSESQRMTGCCDLESQFYECVRPSIDVPVRHPPNT